MKRFGYILLALVFGMCYMENATAQIVALRSPKSGEVVVGNLIVSRDTDNVVVDYDILFGENVKACAVGLYVSTDIGSSWKSLGDGVKGNVGNILQPGPKKILLPLDYYEPALKDKQLMLKLVVHDVVRTVNLAVRGTSNCYVVSRKAFYTFPAVKGNSSESVGKVAAVDVLWETFGSSQAPLKGELISKVYYEDGMISFVTSERYREGNALIAARDASGKILWSWHIWLTDQPVEQPYFNGAAVMMDRNLGATSAEPGDPASLGLFYQWGRKDPFPGSSSVSSYSLAKCTIPWPSAVSSGDVSGTIEYTIARPATFIVHTTRKAEWHNDADSTRWHSDKTIYDPCPPGWRVPDGDVWIKALGPNADCTDIYDRKNRGADFYGKFGGAHQIWYPAAGSLSYTGGTLTNVGYEGYYWSVTPHSPKSLAFFFNNLSQLYPAYAQMRSCGCSVRCQKE